MKEYAVDLHVHIGSSLQGHPIKITASPRLTLSSIMKEGIKTKGLDVVGVVDAACPPVLDDLDFLLGRGDLMEIEEGGFSTKDGQVLIAGSEVEVQQGGGLAHFLAFFPDMESLAGYSRGLSCTMKNSHLSSQRTSLDVLQLYQLVEEHQGIFLPAHAFTPFKSLFGSLTSSLNETLLADKATISQLELGLSADTSMASQLEELEGITFLSNSDAHSLEKMGREFNLLQLERPTFSEVQKALAQEGGRRISANVGLHPRLGKYHRTYCQICRTSFPQYDPPLTNCPHGSHPVVMGVLDRVYELAGDQGPSLDGRPPYHYQLPLEFIPGLGEKGRQRLYSAFGNERQIVHHTPEEELKEVVGLVLAREIVQARQGKLQLKSGGGGVYGGVLCRS